MQFVKERLAKWIQAAVILVVGILCIVAGAAMGGNDPDAARSALDGISLTLGIIATIVGALVLVLAIVVAVIAKKGFAVVAIPGAALLAFGISLLPEYNRYAADLIIILLKVIPYFLLCIGGVIFTDAVFNLVMGILKKAVKGVLVGVIVGMVVGAVAIVLGALCVGSNPVIEFGAQLIVFGIIVCLVAVLLVVLTFVKLPDTVVAVVTVKEDKKEEPEEESK